MVIFLMGQSENQLNPCQILSFSCIIWKQDKPVLLQNLALNLRLKEGDLLFLSGDWQCQPMTNLFNIR